MEESQVLNYVQAAALAVGLQVDPARAHAVAQHFGRTLAMARALDDIPLSPEQEPSEIFCPAPFPAEDAA